MVSHLVFYQLGLIALVWVFLMLYRLWPSEPAAARPMPPKPLIRQCKRSTKSKPFPGLTRKPSCAACEQTIEAPRLQPSPPPPRRFLRHEAAAVTSTPQIISVLIPTVAMVAGSGSAISRPTVIRVAVPGDSSIAAHVAGIFLRRMARRCMVNVSHPTSSCGRWARWRKGLGIRAVARVFEVDPNTVLAWLIDSRGSRESLLAVFLARRARHAGATGRTLCPAQCGQGGQGQ